MNKEIKVTEEYQKAAKEIIEILKILPKEEVDKIPKKLYDFFDDIASKEYEYKLELSVGIDNANLMEKTKDILAMLYRNYWCTEDERREFDALLNENERKYQEELKEKYNPDNIFKKNINDDKDKEIENKQLPVVIEKEKIYKRIINFIKRVLKIGK